MLALLPCCKSQTNKDNNINPDIINIPVINIDEGLNNISEGPYKCSEFIEGIQFVQMETTNNSLFGYGVIGKTLLPSPEYVLCQLKKFSLKDGKFMGQFGKQGRGPGEYIMELSSALDYANNRIFVLDNYGNQIIIYDNDNNFIKKLSVPEEVERIMYLGDDKLILFRFYSMFYKNSVPFEYLIYDINTEQILYTRRLDVIEGFMEESNSDYVDLYGFPSVEHWYFNNNIQVYEGFSDTIFTINTDGTRIPRFYIKREKYKPSVTEMLDNDRYQIFQSKYAKFHIKFETPRFLFMEITKGVLTPEQLKSGLRPDVYCARYDKQTNELTLIPLLNAFENDIAYFHFTSLECIPGTSNGIGVLDIPVNKEEFLLNMQQTLKNNWTESVQKLYDLVREADPRDNGILCIYKLKE